MESVRSIRKLQAWSGTGESRRQFFFGTAVPTTLLGGRHLLHRYSNSRGGRRGRFRQYQKENRRPKLSDGQQTRSIRDCACTPKSATCVINVGPYPVRRNAAFAEQRRTQYSRGNDSTRLPPSWTHATLSVELADDHSRRVGVECGQRLQDKIPAKALPTKEATSAYLHREGRGVHAGRDPKHARQTGYLQRRG